MVVVVAMSCPTLVAWQATVHGILQAGILEWVAISFSFNPYIVSFVNSTIRSYVETAWQAKTNK